MPDSKRSDVDARRRSGSSRRSSASRSGRAKRPSEESSDDRRASLEQRTDSPKYQTMGLMVIVSLLTAVLWGSSRVACNSKTASARQPITLSTKELADDPKNAAFELEQRWAQHDYATARMLAKGEVLTELEESEKQCLRDRRACEREKEALKEKVKSTAALLNRSPKSATVRVRTIGAPGGPRTHTLELVPEDGVWKAVARRLGSK